MRNITKASYPWMTAAILLVGFSCTQKKEHAEFPTHRIDSIINAVPDFSGVVLVGDHGAIQYHKAFGLRDREQHIALDTGDIFELASVSKQFTGMIIMMLQQEGKLAIDDSLSKYLDLPYRGITIRHLLTHTSGVPDYQAVMDQYWDKSKVAGNDDNIAYLIRYHPPILFKPGERYEYSNTGYMLLGSVAEKASGEDFTTMCRERIFSKLSMKDTDLRTRDAKASITNFAKGYIFKEQPARYVLADSFPEFNYAIWLGNREGPGRISSTSRDLLLWDQALQNGTLVSGETLQQAFMPMKLNDATLSYYGFGWRIENLPGVGQIVLHTGDNPGYKTEIVRYTDRGKVIIFLNNNYHVQKKEIMRAIRDVVERSMVLAES